MDPETVPPVEPNTVAPATKESEPRVVVIASNLGPSKWPMTPGLPHIAKDENGDPLDLSGQAYGDRG